MIDLSLTEVREGVRAGNRLCDGGPEVLVTDLPAAPGGPACPVRIYQGPTMRATMVYAHGGGWVTGDLDYSAELCRHLAADADVRVISVDYRLAPEHPFPAGLTDIEATWTWARETYAGPLGLGGDSAGGHLAAALTARLDGSVMPEFLVLIYPVLDLPDQSMSYRTQAHAFPIGAADMRWFWRAYLAGQTPPRSPDVTPGRFVPRLPGPAHVVAAGHDPLHDEGVAYAEQLAAAGAAVTLADHPDLCHGFLRFTAITAAARAARDDLVTAVSRLVERLPEEP